MIEGETIATGAPSVCGETWGGSKPCAHVFKMEVLHSAAGYYLGTACPAHGPNSRESGYYPTHDDAERALATGDINWRDSEWRGSR